MTWPPGGTEPSEPSSSETTTGIDGSPASSSDEPPGVHRRQAHSIRWRSLAVVALGAGVVLTVMLTLWVSNGRLNGRVDRLEDASSSRGQALEVACKQVEAAGGRCAVGTPAPDRPEQPVAVPTSVPVTVDYDRIVRQAVAQVRAMVRDGAQGKPGPAPTSGQIEAAVRAVCAGGRCGPSEGAIAAAVGAYFAANPPPSGPAGPTGAPGAVGADGSNGADGQPGPAGAPGRGIDRTEVRDCQMTVWYDDGTSDGPFDVCQPSPSPTATTEPPILPLPT